jgi:5-methylthioadenosine/S-adenosylhomocysteine deaminase
MRTCIRRAAWTVAFDRARDAHVYLRDVDVAFDPSGIVHVGADYRGAVDVEVDGSERLVIPGLIDLHCHPSAQAIFRGLTEEFGNPRLFYSGRHRFRQSFAPDAAAAAVSARFTLAELLAGGVTTVVDLSHAYPGWLTILAESGMRAVVAPMFRSAEWFTDTGQETRFEPIADGGAAAFEEARAVMDEAERHPSGLLSAMVSPAQVDTCSEALLRAARALSDATQRPLHVHAAQSYAEFQGMTRRFDVTPIGYLERIGFLGPRTLLGHAVFSDEHPWLHWHERRDLARLAASGTAIAHCPTVFARDGTLLHDLGRYRAAGVGFGIGTDTHPHHMIEELRVAEVNARLAAGPTHSLSTAAVFEAATLGGARVLGRDDLGRLAVGARADVVLIDVAHPHMQPAYDPLRSLIYGAADRAVESVWIDGRRRVEAGQPIGVDRVALGRALAAAQRRAEAGVVERAGAPLAAIAPRVLPVVDAVEA